MFIVDDGPIPVSHEPTETLTTDDSTYCSRYNMALGGTIAATALIGYGCYYYYKYKYVKFGGKSWFSGEEEEE